jgi:hypothetical protein
MRGGAQTVNQGLQIRRIARLQNVSFEALYGEYITKLTRQIAVLRLRQLIVSTMAEASSSGVALGIFPSPEFVSGKIDRTSKVQPGQCAPVTALT